MFPKDELIDDGKRKRIFRIHLIWPLDQWTNVINERDDGCRVATGSLPPELGKLADVSQVDLSCNLLGGEWI